MISMHCGYNLTLKRGPTSLCLILSLCACAHTLPLIQVDRPLPIYPPRNLMLDTPLPGLSGVRSNADLLDALINTLDALNACNADKAALRAWSDH